MRIRSSLLLIAAAVFALVTVGFNSAAMAQKVTGAIFTTLIDGSAVDHNIYNAKQDVYLNGGPNSLSAPCTAAGLPDGEYFFQVTDPSGKIVLSTDPLAERKVRVQGGIIKSYLGHTHSVSVGKCGSVTVQLMPFDDTPNPGGEYKAWMTPVAGYKGFLPSKSKTDNFKAPGDTDIDSDDDGLTDEAEIALGTLPNNPDTDGDGLTDGQEVNDYHTNPLEPDSDFDGISDKDEVTGVTGLDGVIYQTNPNSADSDNDTLSDFDELFIFGTNPNSADSDNDTVPDSLDRCPGINDLDPILCPVVVPG